MRIAFAQKNARILLLRVETPLMHACMQQELNRTTTQMKEHK